jgi:excisionase family DNA binding protein
MASSSPFGEDRLYTVAEVATHMRVSNMTVYRLIKGGTLPAIRVGKNYRIRATDLARYLDASATVFEQQRDAEG